MTAVPITPDTATDDLADVVDRMGPELWSAQMRLKQAHRDVTSHRASMITAARTRAELVREMRTVHGWSYRRIADYLGVSHNALVQSAHVSVSGSDGDAS
ncbi:Uncharacterised protein [Mycobacteroides abscessus subsp. abscessus]|uniref:hypothetical protein n=1 Tax=Mycobacteroides abscessus TaxID=36809 RepID=UPI0009D4F5FA|nr:hypothetical protein [Mycobacteroides abscessus]SKV12405.1 Uncharacterised protein [Mycobacteroides abscessus subsp. abscessus]